MLQNIFLLVASLIFYAWGEPVFVLITPRFETDLTVEQPPDNEPRNGSFEDTVLYQDNLNQNYYRSSMYNVYSGGNCRIQVIKNNLKKDGKKILIIRDSYAMVVTPFLALNTGELHVCDIRSIEKISGEKLDLKKYIKAISPDYVLVLYDGSANEEGKFSFFSE